MRSTQLRHGTWKLSQYLLPDRNQEYVCQGFLNISRNQYLYIQLQLTEKTRRIHNKHQRVYIL
jgi:hypothetical protein